MNLNMLKDFIFTISSSTPEYVIIMANVAALKFTKVNWHSPAAPSKLNVAGEASNRTWYCTQLYVSSIDKLTMPQIKASKAGDKISSFAYYLQYIPSFSWKKGTNMTTNNY